MGYFGHWLAIKSFKHDGTLHRIWDRGLVLENTDEYVIIASKRAKVVETNGRSWFTREPAVTIFSKTHWWNVICMIKNDGIHYYCNIASPALIDKGFIKYIDYDLDVKLFPNDYTRVLDEKEYSIHKKVYSYGEKLDQVLHIEMQNILEKMHNREFPFQDETISSYYDKFLGMIKK
ncbi:MAG: DUF402 domain-containing protein [Bacilli bacterium]